MSSTCSTANISVAMVDSSLPKLMHKLSRDALCIHVSVDGYLWSGFNSAELSTVTTVREKFVTEIFSSMSRGRESNPGSQKVQA